MRLFKQGINFKCIADKCIDSCCTGWDITFDKKTFEKVSEDPRFNKTMTDHAYINDAAHIETINYAIIDLLDDGRCPFLDNDDLCILQKKNGANELSNVCALYPRYYNVVDGVYEESLSLACIEATEILLFGDPLELVEIERGPKRDVVMQNIVTQTSNPTGLSLQHLYDFRKYVFSVLKNTTYSFEEQLGILKAFHEDLSGVNGDTLKARLDTYDFESPHPSIGIDEATYGKLIDFLRNVGQSDHIELDDLIRRCIEDVDYSALRLEKLPSIDRVMSNYLIHQMFKELYPYIAGYSKLDSFQHLVKKVQLLRLLIAYDGDFDEKRVARIIQMYAKGLEHHGAFHYELDHLVL